MFFSLLIMFTGICFFIPGDLNRSSQTFLLFISIASLLSLTLSGFYFQKETRVILICIFLVINLFLLSAFSGIIFSRTKKFKFFRSILIFFILLIVCTSIVFIKVLNFTDDSIKYANGNSKANSGVILGAAVWGGNRPSPVLKERINKGYDVYQKNIVPKLVITGGGSPNELTEGEVSKNVLIKYGVAPENLILENSSSSTVEQIQFVRDSLYNVKNWEKIILISDNFHLFRAQEICKFNDINADSIASDKDISAEGTLSFCLKESLALIIFWMSGV